jgi:hypothetical protein
MHNSIDLANRKMPDGHRLTNEEVDTAIIFSKNSPCFKEALK